MAITNEHGEIFTFDLDAHGRIEIESGFGGLRRQYIRDKAGRVVKVFRPADRTTEYAYDEVGRVAKVKYSSGESEAYSYRADGELIGVKNDVATVVLERDLLGRIVREVVGDDWVASEYDALGNRIRIRSSAGLTSGLPATPSAAPSVVRASVAPGGQQTDPDRLGSAVTRDTVGLEVERHLPGGVRARWKRDADRPPGEARGLGRLASSAVPSSTAGTSTIG